MTRLYRPLLVAGMVHIAALVPVLAAMSVDDRLILGINPWIKPAKFLLSVGVYLITLAWMLPRVRGAARSKAVIGWGVLIVMSGEIVAIVTQAARGTTSHFNITTLVDAVIFQAMGVMIMINTGRARPPSSGPSPSRGSRGSRSRENRLQDKRRARCRVLGAACWVRCFRAVEVLDERGDEADGQRRFGIEPARDLGIPVAHRTPCFDVVLHLGQRPLGN